MVKQFTILKRLNNLHWRLTLSYTLVTTMVLLISNSAISLLAIYRWERNVVFHSELKKELASPLNLLPVLLNSSSPENLKHWIDQVWQTGFYVAINKTTSMQVYYSCISLVGVKGNILAQRLDEFGTADRNTTTEFCYAKSNAFQQRLTTNTIQHAYDIQWSHTENILAGVLPIKNTQHDVYLVVEVFHFGGDLWIWFSEFLYGFWQSLLLSLVIGIAFGYAASRGLVKRLRLLGEVVQHWAKGQFHQKINDHSGDEISTLTTGLDSMAVQLENLMNTKQQLGAMEERGRLARELHDTIKQHIFSEHMQLSSLKIAQADKPKLANQLIDNLLLLNKQIQRDLSDIIQALNPTQLKHAGLLETLKTYLFQWQNRTGVAVSMQGTLPCSLSPTVEFALFRIIIEALNNVEKHAKAQSADIAFTVEDDRFIVRIEDNGKGFNTISKKSGYGLTSIKERAAMFNGTVAINSCAVGTCVELSLPLITQGEQQHVPEC